MREDFDEPCEGVHFCDFFFLQAMLDVDEEYCLLPWQSPAAADAAREAAGKTTNVVKKKKPVRSKHFWRRDHPEAWEALQASKKRSGDGEEHFSGSDGECCHGDMPEVETNVGSPDKPMDVSTEGKSPPCEVMSSSLTEGEHSLLTASDIQTAGNPSTGGGCDPVGDPCAMDTRHHTLCDDQSEAEGAVILPSDDNKTSCLANVVSANRKLSGAGDKQGQTPAEHSVECVKREQDSLKETSTNASDNEEDGEISAGAEEREEDDLEEGELSDSTQEETPAQADEVDREPPTGNMTYLAEGRKVDKAPEAVVDKKASRADNSFATSAAVLAFSPSWWKLRGSPLVFEKRHVSQMLVRGDNIIMISLVRRT